MAPAHPQSAEDEITRYRAFLNSIPDGSRLSTLLSGSMAYVERSIRENIDQSAGIMPFIESLEKRIAAANIRANEEAERKIAAEKEIRRIEEDYAKIDAENDRLREDCERSAREVARLTARLRIHDLETEAARIADELTRARAAVEA